MRTFAITTRGARTRGATTRGATTRGAVAALLMALGTAAAGAQPVPLPSKYGPLYPWCAEYGGGRGGGTNCYFVTYDQCRAAISGNGGFCYQNPFYAEAVQAAPPPGRRARSH